MYQNWLTRTATKSGILLTGWLLAAPAGAIDWSGVAAKQLVLYYPGQSSWEYVLIPSQHDGAEKFRGGKDCLECHEDEEPEMGETVSSGEKLEPEPIEGKPPSLAVDVKAAYDDERLYVQLSWEDTGFEAPEPDSEGLIHVNMMLGDGTVPSYSRGGCWATCHADLKGMPHDTGEELTKYLARSRTKVTSSGGGTNYKSDGDLSAMLNDGVFIEYWQASVADRNAEATAESGYILDKRHEIQGAVSATAGLDGGRWTVEMSRALQPAGAGQKSLTEGETYIVGFAIHDGHATGRRHYTAFKRTLTLGGDGDIAAVRQ